MKVRHPSRNRSALLFLLLATFWLLLLVPLSVMAAPYAAVVMDARTGKILHSRNADARLHPASLTKMMTLYIAFEAVEHGEIGLDTLVTVSRKAASEPPSRLGLKAGQKIKLRYLLRAAAVKSANDAATAIAEAIAGSEAAFARRMNRTAKALGMTRTTFKNAHGLTEAGHLSTARDMTILGRHLIYDYPEYYNLFSRKTADAGLRTVRHTNGRLLSSYRGADGIKTGYTRASGFNLVASAERGSERVIATVFGGRTAVSRDRKVAELLDMGFARAPTRVAFNPPKKPPYLGPGGQVRVAGGAVARSLRPQARPGAALPPPSELVAGAVLEEALREAAATQPPGPRPMPRPGSVALASAGSGVTAEGDAVDDVVQEVVTRLSTSGGRNWGINVGRYTTRYEAEKVLLKTALAEIGTLEEALRKVVRTSRGWDANFFGLTREQADLACRRLHARGMGCFMVGPS